MIKERLKNWLSNNKEVNYECALQEFFTDVFLDQLYDTMQSYCPYCGILMNKKRLERHIKERCPKRPDIELAISEQK